jgi:hypothetical protein
MVTGYRHWAKGAGGRMALLFRHWLHQGALMTDKSLIRFEPRRVHAMEPAGLYDSEVVRLQQEHEFRPEKR